MLPGVSLSFHESPADTWGDTRKNVRTTRSSKTGIPQDRMNGQFVAEWPDLLWVADFIYVSTCQGFAYVALAYTQRLNDAVLLASIGSTGDSYANTMAESISGLYKAEMIRRQSWKTRQDVELAMLKWVD